MTTYKDKTVFSVKEINEVTQRENFASDFIYKRKGVLKEGIDYYRVSAEEYKKATGFKTTVKGTLFTIVGINTMADNMRDGDTKERLLSLITTKIRDYQVVEEPVSVRTKRKYVRKNATNKVSVKNGTEVKAKKEKKVTAKKELVVDMPISETPIEPVVEVKEKQIVETKEVPIKEEKHITVDISGFNCDMNKMFENLVEMQIKTNELVNKQMELYAKQLDAYAKQNDELRDMVKDLINYNVQQPIVASINEDEFPDYGTYLKEAYKAANKVLALEGNNKKYANKFNVLAEAYKALNKEYGIVWDQIKKDFYKALGRSSTSTAELCWFYEQQNPVCRNLLISKLNTIYEEDKKAI